jgi:hypothetical protein
MLTAFTSPTTSVWGFPRSKDSSWLVHSYRADHQPGAYIQHLAGQLVPRLHTFHDVRITQKANNLRIIEDISALIDCR